MKTFIFKDIKWIYNILTVENYLLLISPLRKQDPCYHLLIHSRESVF